jgi:hypothetical protein
MYKYVPDYSTYEASNSFATFSCAQYHPPSFNLVTLTRASCEEVTSVHFSFDRGLHDITYYGLPLLANYYKNSSLQFGLTICWLFHSSIVSLLKHQ